MEGNKEEIINLDKVITPNEEKEEDVCDEDGRPL